jgi:hypothetical protein
MGRRSLKVSFVANQSFAAAIQESPFQRFQEIKKRERILLKEIGEWSPSKGNGTFAQNVCSHLNTQTTYTLVHMYIHMYVHVNTYMIIHT